MKINISLIQPDIIWENIPANLDKYESLLTEVPKETEIIILPEMFATGFTMQVDHFNSPVGVEVFEWLQQKAFDLQKIIVGSILTEEASRYYNRLYWMRPDGTYEFYDKRHLFHQGGEDRIMTAGQSRVVVTYKGIRFLLQICYDLRFPVWSKNKYDQAKDTYDYDAIIYVANWPESRKQAYENLLKARAIENQAVVIWVNRVGEDGQGIKHSGDTKIIDGLGNLQGQAPAGKEIVLTGQIDFQNLFELRKRFKVGLDWDKFEVF